MRKLVVNMAFGLIYYLPSWLWLDKLCTKVVIWKSNGKWPNTNRPKTFSDICTKINFEQINGLRSIICNKFYLRYYVTATIGPKFLLPLIDHIQSMADYHKLCEANFEPCVLKPAHGSGAVFFANSIQELKSKECQEFCTQMLKLKYDRLSKQITYGTFERSIIVEKNMGTIDGRTISDYKIHCFHGIPTIVQHDEGRFQNHTQTFYDPSWQHLDVNVLAGVKSSPSLEKKPSCLEAIIDTARNLSKGLDYVRVDLYAINESIYVGEMTSFPWGGKYGFKPSKFDRDLAKLYNESMSTEDFFSNWPK
ncbi:hypothetical protein K3729_18570 (plasmid) [Rhodobacteraceae bacterium S2214]|nr:hypothetical protein K3729_18570 [Rhodobacteraceae bacterium S2214]